MQRLKGILMVGLYWLRDAAATLMLWFAFHLIGWASMLNMDGTVAVMDEMVRNYIREVWGATIAIVPITKPESKVSQEWFPVGKGRGIVQ